MSGRPRRSSSKAASAKSSDRDDSSKEKQPTVPRLDFPFLLHRFLTEEAAITEKKPSVAGWSVAGDQFYIHYEDAALLSERMEPYFRRTYFFFEVGQKRGCLIHYLLSNSALSFFHMHLFIHL